MSRAIAPLPPRATYTSEPTHRFTVNQLQDLIDRGRLTDDDLVELIEGVPVLKMPENESHIAAGRRLRRAVEAVLPPTRFYDVEQPVALAAGEPEPDEMVVRESIEDYDAVKVGPAGLAMTIKISDSTLDWDRGMKLGSYFRTDVACYWTVNLVDRRVEVDADPDSAADLPRYGPPAMFGRGDVVSLTLDGRVVGHVAFADVLPPAGTD